MKKIMLWVIFAAAMCAAAATNEPVRGLRVFTCAHCFYACMYQRSPVGLPPVKSWGLDEKLIRLLQELAWDAVSVNSSTH